MRTALSMAAVVVLTSSIAVTAPADAAKKPTYQGVDTSPLTKAVSVNGILQNARALQVIANNNDGNRASGLPGHTASAAYVADKLRKAGYTVKRQKFTFAFSRELEPATLAQISPTPGDIETTTMDYSGSGEVTGRLVPTNDILIPPTPEPSSTSGCEPEDFVPASATDPEISLVQRGTCTFEDKANNAVAAGYDAVIEMNEGQPGRDELLTGTLGNPSDVPVVGVSYADGKALHDAAQEGPVVVEVTTSTENDLNRQTENVIADLPVKKGTRAKNSDEVVVVGAHLDSVAAGPGINDNGSGSAAVLEIAEQMSQLKLTKKLERPVRFAFWGAEEAGLLGSTHYVETLSSYQLSKIYANLNFDMLASPNYGRLVYDGDGSAGDPGPPGSAEIETVFTRFFTKKGLKTGPTAFDGRSDYGPFIDAGIPAGGLFSGAEEIKTAGQATKFGGTAGEPFDACYHQACDTINNLNSKALQEMGDAAAHAVGMLTLSKRGLFGDVDRASAKKKASKPVGPLRVR